MDRTRRIQPWRVVVAGGGVAGVEACMGLTDLADRRLQVALVTPEDRFSLRPYAIGEPFGGAPTPSFALADITRELGARFIRDRVVGVRPADMLVDLAGGGTVPYDVLVLAVGTHQRAMDPRVLTFGGPDAVKGVREVIGSLTSGRADRAAFVVPTGTTWPLPAYELALMARGRSGHGRVALITPEAAPLELFGEGPSAEVAGLLADAGVEVHLGADPRIGRDGQAVGLAEDGPWVTAQRIVALPVIDGPALPGVPRDAAGFIPVDEFCRVVGLEHVYAAGDATDQPVKQGGLAAQQAYTAARHIAAAAGGLLDPEVFRPVLRGRLLTGGRDRFLRHDPEGDDAVSAEELWWPPAKVVGHYLAPWIAAQKVGSRWADRPQDGIAVQRDLGLREGAAVPGLDSLGPLGRRPWDT